MAFIHRPPPHCSGSSSLICVLFLTITGFQLAVGSIVTSSNSVLVKECNIPQIYWSISSPSNNAVLLHTGQRQEPRSQFNCRYASKSKHCMCLQSWPRAGNVIRLNVMGHFNETLMAVCSTPSSPFMPLFGVPAFVKFLLILVMQCSAGNNRFRNNPWRTDRTLGR